MKVKVIASVILTGALLLSIFFLQPNNPKNSDPETVQKSGSQRLALSPYKPDFKKVLDPDTTEKNGRSALTQAAELGDTNYIFHLISEYDDLNLGRPDKNGDNALTTAIMGQQTEIVRKLEEAGVVLDREAVKRYSASFISADIEKMKWFLWRQLPFGDPQVLKPLYDPEDKDDMERVLEYGYQPTRAEAANAVKDDFMSDVALGSVYRLYPELFSREQKNKLYVSLSRRPNTPLERLYAEMLLPAIDAQDLTKVLKQISVFPTDWILSQRDIKEIPDSFFRDLRYADDMSQAELLKLGIEIRNDDTPFTFAVRDNKYATVQQYINQGVDPNNSDYPYSENIMRMVIGDLSKGNLPTRSALEMAKLLLDNGVNSEEDADLFYTAIDKFGSYFDKYRPYDSIPLKLASSPNDDLYILAYSRKDKRYSLIKQNENGETVWNYPFKGKRFYNVLDNPSGLYFENDRLLLVQNRFIDGRRITRLSLFNPDGLLMKQYDGYGVFEKIVLQSEGYALVTNRTNVFLDQSLNPVGNLLDHQEAFYPAVPSKTIKSKAPHDNGYLDDIRKEDFYSDRTLILYNPTYGQTTPEKEPQQRSDSSQIALALSKDGEVSFSSVLSGEYTTALDYTFNDKHAYILLATQDQVVIQRRSADFKILAGHYIEFDRRPGRKTLDDMECDETGCSIVGKFMSNHPALVRTIPGTKTQRLVSVRSIFHTSSDRHNRRQRWHVLRNGESDLIVGNKEIMFTNGKAIKSGDTVLLDFTEGLTEAENGVFYAYGIYEKKAAFEKMTTEGEMLAHFDLDFGFADSRIYDMQILTNGNLLIVGHLYQEYNYFRTFAALLDANGNQIWSRIYKDMKSLKSTLLASDESQFLAIVDGKQIVKFSLEDGSLIERLHDAEGVTKLYQSPSGDIVGVGNKNIDSKAYIDWQPVLYCISKDAPDIRKSRVSDTGDDIRAISSWNGGLVAAVSRGKHSSTQTNLMLARIDTNSCTLNYDWQE